MMMQCKSAEIYSSKKCMIMVVHGESCEYRFDRSNFYQGSAHTNPKQKATQRVDEGQFSEFIGILNYCVMTLIQIDKGIADQPDMSEDDVLSLYNAQIDLAKSLMQNKKITTMERPGVICV